MSKQLIEQIINADSYIGCIEILAFRDGLYHLQVMNKDCEDIGITTENHDLEKGLKQLLAEVKIWSTHE